MQTVPDDTPSVWDRLLLVYLAPRRRPLARHHRLVFLFWGGYSFFCVCWDCLLLVFLAAARRSLSRRHRLVFLMPSAAVRPSAASVCGLELLVYEALSY